MPPRSRQLPKPKPRATSRLGAASKPARGSGVLNRPARRGFSRVKQLASRLEASLAHGRNYMRTHLAQTGLDAPHRAPYKELRNLIEGGDRVRIKNAMDTLARGSREYEAALKNTADLRRAVQPKTAQVLNRLEGMYRQTRGSLENALDGYLRNPSPLSGRTGQTLLRAANDLASNSPGLGPAGTNRAVGSRLHPNIKASDGSATPRTLRAGEAFPETPWATDAGGSRLITPDGYLRRFNQELAARLQGLSDSTNITSDAPGAFCGALGLTTDATGAATVDVSPLVSEALAEELLQLLPLLL